MKIASSQVDMGSSRTYYQAKNRSKNSNLNSRSFLGVASKAFDVMEKYDTSANYSKNGTLADGQRVEATNTASDLSTQPSGFSNSVLYSLLQKLLNGGAFDIPGFSSDGYSQQIITYQEQESMSFQAQGQAVTEDGRQIDFDISLYMSRSFMQYMNVNIPSAQNALMDPLVINIGTGAATVTDQKFKFDLDADGQEDLISMPTMGSAFLALDKNGDGMINDGNELFGTQSGDGFGDLRQYDNDGNGWIDENDEIFDKLRVWYKDAYGRDVLVNLKDADVGAIFLGEQRGDFTLNDASGGTSGVIRSSGIFLKESGGVGTIQHVDLAVAKDQADNTGSDTPAVSEANEVTPEQTKTGALTIDLTNDNTPAINKAARERLNRRSQLEAKRVERAARKKQLDEHLKKRREERKELQEELWEKKVHSLHWGKSSEGYDRNII